MTEDSMHRTLDAALVRSAAPAERNPTLTVAQVNALTGDDIETWLTNPFMDPGMLADKVCWWVTAALAAVADDGLAERVRGLADEWEAEAAEDQGWLNGPRVEVSEAHELPALIRQAGAHVRELRALLSPAPSADRDERDGA